MAKNSIINRFYIYFALKSHACDSKADIIKYQVATYAADLIIPQSFPERKPDAFFSDVTLLGIMLSSGSQPSHHVVAP